MARTVIISVVLSLLIVGTGCQTADTGQANRLPSRGEYLPPPAPTPSGATPSVVNANDEAALVEQVTKYRRDYRDSLALLLKYYISAANNIKQSWAKEELQELDRIPQYVYIVDPSVLPETLRATERIQDADAQYFDAQKAEQQAKPFGNVPTLVDEGRLRVAQQKYFQVIRLHPTSDKIKDAAWHEAGIYEYFGDYGTAILFYKRAFQWDPDTAYPARYNAARLLDKLGRRDEALPLYQEALTKEAKFTENTPIIQRRIKDLTSPK
jgi:tetratricopeptide (TPR) repeat protein